MTASLSLAIGIGANTTIFTVANALLFRDPIGVADPDRLIDIGISRDGRGFGSGSYPNYIDITERVTRVEGVYAHPRFPEAMSLGSSGSGSRVAFGTEVSINYFSTLKAVPAAGRLFGSADSPETGAGRVAVLSHRFWTRQFIGTQPSSGRRCSSTECSTPSSVLPRKDSRGPGFALRTCGYRSAPGRPVRPDGC